MLRSNNYIIKVHNERWKGNQISSFGVLFVSESSTFTVNHIFHSYKSEVIMFLERMVFHAKPGKVRELVNIFKEFRNEVPEWNSNMHIFTDVVGESWTLILERDIENLDEVLMSTSHTEISDKAKQLMMEYHNYIQSGSREIYKYED